MNIRKALYFGSWRLRGSAIPSYYARYVREDQAGIPPDTTRRLLIEMLEHCRRAVPYYAEVMRNLGHSFQLDPDSYLRQFPILTKDLIRQNFDRLKSADLARRRWYLNTSGGSTGEPIRFIQDQDYMDRSYPITMLFSRWAGKEVGAPEVRLWGSVEDIIRGSVGWRATLAGKLTHTHFLNAFHLTPERMREFIAVLNRERPKLIVAYAHVMWELARFAEREGMAIIPQQAIMTSANVLLPPMRETIQGVFRCKVYDRYGSREVGDIACQCPALEGLHVAPWGNYVEIVDDQGRRVPDGAEGDILVTSLTNFAMPMIRYRIGDRGILATKPCACGKQGQVLERVAGRSADVFRQADGTLVDSGYCASLLYFKAWVRKAQVIQKGYSHIVFRIVRSEVDVIQAEVDEIIAKTRILMGQDCIVAFEFVEDIAPTPSGKHRWTVSEIPA